MNHFNFKHRDHGKSETALYIQHYTIVMGVVETFLLLNERILVITLKGF